MSATSKGFRITVTFVFVFLLGSCTAGSPSTKERLSSGPYQGRTSPSPITSQSPVTASPAAFKWPRRAKIVGTIRAPKPPADDVRLYKPILLRAYRKACSDVVDVASAFRDFRPQSQLILIRCGSEPVRAVRLVFTGVVVPNMRPVIREAGMQPQNVLAAVGLRWHFTWRSAPGFRWRLITQDPAPGQIVPFGTVVHVVIAR